MMARRALMLAALLVLAAGDIAVAEELTAAELKEIRADVKSGDRAREQMALLRLGRVVPRVKDTVPLCRQVLRSSHSALSRFYAAMVLASEPKGGPVLVKALKDASPDVRGMAAEALGVLGYRAAIKPLRKVVASDPDDEVTAYAAAALLSMEAVDAKVISRRLAELVARKEWPRSLRKRGELKRIAGYGPLEELEGGLVLLTRTLSAVATRSTRSGLVEAALHGSTDVRLAAAESLGALAKPGDYDVVSTLELLRKDHNPGVRAAAMKALVSIGYAGKSGK